MPFKSRTPLGTNRKQKTQPGAQSYETIIIGFSGEPMLYKKELHEFFLYFFFFGRFSKRLLQHSSRYLKKNRIT